MTAGDKDGLGNPVQSQPAQDAHEPSAAADPSSDYKVGYGKPPLHSRWKPGQSGNSKGSKQKPSSVREKVQAQLERKLTTSNGQQISVADAILNAAITGLIAKDGRSVKRSIELIDFLQRFDTKVGFAPRAADERRLNTLITELKSKGEI